VNDPSIYRLTVHDRWLNVNALKFGAHYLDNGWGYIRCNGAPIGNDYLGIKWSRDVMTDDVT